MLERQVEAQLKILEGYGFKCHKLRTPGSSGVPDRMILAPTWSPAPPIFVEMKRPGERERALQVAVREAWIARGCDVRDACDTIDAVVKLCTELLHEAESRVPFSVHLPWVRTRWRGDI